MAWYLCEFMSVEVEPGRFVKMTGPAFYREFMPNLSFRAYDGRGWSAGGIPEKGVAVVWTNEDIDLTDARVAQRVRDTITPIADADLSAHDVPADEISRYGAGEAAARRFVARQADRARVLEGGSDARNKPLSLKNVFGSKKFLHCILIALPHQQLFAGS